MFGEAGVCAVLGNGGVLTPHSAPIGAPGAPGPGDDAWIIFTSGSTGKPKGVVHVHGGYLSGLVETMRASFDAQPGDTMYVVADPGWITGQSYMIAAALAALGVRGGTELALCREAGVPLGAIPALLDGLRAAGAIVEVPLGPRRSVRLLAEVAADLEDRLLRALDERECALHHVRRGRRWRGRGSLERVEVGVRVAVL